MSNLSRVAPIEPRPELTWTCTKIATSGANTYGPWLSIFDGWPTYMKSPGRELPLPRIPAVFSYEHLVVNGYQTTNEGTLYTSYYSGGNPANKETTRAVCSLTRGGTVVARLYAINRGYYAHRYSCEVTSATNGDPDCVDIIVTYDPEKEAIPEVTAPAGYYENLARDIGSFNVYGNVALDISAGVNHFKNVNFDAPWCNFTLDTLTLLVGQEVSVIFSLGGGRPDLGVYDFAGAVESSYEGAPYVNVTAGYGEQMRAFLNCLLFSGYTVLRSATNSIVSTDAPNSNQWPDLWTTTTAPDVDKTPPLADYPYNERSNWALLLCPDGVSQLCLRLANSGWILMHWSYGGLFTGGTGLNPPTATDARDITEYSPGNQENWSTVCTFYGFKGVRNNGQITSRVMVNSSPGANQEQILRTLSFEWFVTDIPVGTYARNVCMVGTHGGYYRYAYTKNSVARVMCYMPDGKRAYFCVSGIQTTQYWGSQDLSDNKGTLDGKYRLEPVYLSTNAGGYQFFGYLPDFYWADILVLNQTNKTYTFNGVWKKIGPSVLPTFETTYTTNVGDYPACRMATRTPGTTRDDRVVPTFAGVVSATAIDDNTVRLTWESGSDDITSAADLKYEIHYATQPSAAFSVRDSLTGVS